MQNKPKQQLSARWTHEERSAILVDRLGHGDISSWAKGISRPFGSVFRPIRPEVGVQPVEFNPIRKLGNLVPFVPVKNDAMRQDITPCPTTGFDETEYRTRCANGNVAIALEFEKFYRSMRKPGAKVVVVDYGDVTDSPTASTGGCKLTWKAE